MPGDAPALEDVSETMALFDIAGLTFGGTCTYNANNSNLVVALAAGDSVIIGRSSSNGAITINGNTLYCGNANYANVKDMNIFVPGGGVGSDETVVLDYTNGTFAWVNGANSGTQYDTGGSNSGADYDTLQIRMQNGNAPTNQNVTVGSTGIHLAGNANKDIAIQNTNNPNLIAIALGGGNDRFNGLGDATVGGAPAATRLLVYGNAGADVIYTSGGNFNDAYYGNDGNDTIYVAAAVTTGCQITLDGGNNFDTVDWSSRTGAVNIAIGQANASGDITGGTEFHTIASTVESLVGGSGADIISGGAAGTNAVLFGGPGNDNFVQLGASTGDSNDTVWGGAGTDTVNYAQRTVAVNVTLDGNPNDGSISTTGEKDNVQLDVENIISGSGVDVLVGNANDNVINAGGGTGNTVYGLGGDDTFLQNTLSNSDLLYGGTGVDTVSYENRAAAITAALDGTATSGASGENDTLSTDIENLTGGKGANAQVLTGNTGDNVISAGVASSGTRTIDCKGGADVSIHGVTVTNCEISIP